MAQPYLPEKIDRIRRLYETHGVVTAARIAGVSENGIRLMKRRGWTVGQAGPSQRPIPTDFAIQSACMRLHDLARHYRAGVSTVSKWADAVGRKPMRADRSLPIPFDVVATVKQLGSEAAARHYEVSDDTMRRWRRRVGLPIGRAVTRPRDWTQQFRSAAA